MTPRVLMLKAHLVIHFFCSCSEPIMFSCVLYKSTTQLLTRIYTPRWAGWWSPAAVWWRLMQSLRRLGLSLEPSGSSWGSLHFANFSLSTLHRLFPPHSLMRRDDKKCHLRSHRLSWFPWQLQQQSDVPLGPWGPRRPATSRSLWEGCPGRGWWQVVYAHWHSPNPPSESNSVCPSSANRWRRV